jgi:hypothetical protein
MAEPRCLIYARQRRLTDANPPFEPWGDSSGPHT